MNASALILTFRCREAFGVRRIPPLLDAQLTTVPITGDPSAKAKAAGYAALQTLRAIRFTLVVLGVTLLAVPTLHAQFVNDGATNTLSNITNLFTGDVTVGTNCAFTLLILSDN